MAQAERRRDESIVKLRRLCETLEKCCNETNERRVANCLKDVNSCWETLEEREYSQSIRVSTLDEAHADDLKESYDLKEKTIMLAEDYLWSAEDRRKAAFDDPMEERKDDNDRVVLANLKEEIVRNIGDVKATEESIMEADSSTHVDAVKVLYEKYINEFTKLSNEWQNYVKEEPKCCERNIANVY